MTVVRRHGELGAILSSHLAKPPRGQGLTWPILLAGAAQLLYLKTAHHAAISLAVDQVRADHRSRHLTGLVNAVLRKVAATAPDACDGADPVALNVPEWMLARWKAAYGPETAVAIARCCLLEPALDITVKSDPERWAERLSGLLLPTGTVRLLAKGPVEEIDGYGEGQWWVQDAAAALPARLLGAVAGLRVADLCAAPGGKTAELAAAGALVTAVDVSRGRLDRLEANLRRLKLDAEVVTSDVEAFRPSDPFDAVLLDAPCTATGTIRRHPDILHSKGPADIKRLAGAQARLLVAAARLVRPGGLLVYCTCSLEPEEGPDQIARFLSSVPGASFRRIPVEPSEIGGCCEMITPDGDLRTLPVQLPHASPELAGLDGFFACRLKRVTGGDGIV